MRDRERFLVTGALGCLGAWILRTLVHGGVDVVGIDRASDRRRLRLLQDGDELEGVPVLTVDVADVDALDRSIREERITHVIHGAALQVPFVRADPLGGARVNVEGFAAVLEAIRRNRERVQGVAYASSAAVFGSATHYVGGRVDDLSPPAPETLYGVYKLANEGMAAVYDREHGIRAVGLRPFVVYGAGRDAGLTAASTLAIGAALRDAPFVIEPGGPMSFDYAADTAAAFIAAARLKAAGSMVLNVPGVTADAADVIAAIERHIPAAAGRITVGPTALALPAIVDASEARARLRLPEPTTLEDGIMETIAMLRRGHERGLVAA